MNTTTTNPLLRQLGLDVATVQRYVLAVRPCAAADRTRKTNRGRRLPPEPLSAWQFTGRMRRQEFLFREARRLGLTPQAVDHRIGRGKYPGLVKHRIGHYDTEFEIATPGGASVPAIRRPKKNVVASSWNFPGRIPCKEFVRRELERLGLSSIAAIHKRINTGKYPGLRKIHLNARVVLCEVKL